MLSTSHHIKSGHHGSVAHRKRIRHSWAILAVILTPILLLYISGALIGIDWQILGISLGLSFVRLLVGYSISLLFGVTLALIIGWSRYTNMFLPFLDVLQNVPYFALIPVFVLLFGFSNSMIVIFTATSVIWPILFYTLSALRAARVDLNDAATVFGAAGFKRLLYYLMPLSVPAVLTGSIVGISIGWETVIGVEIIGQMGGIGTFLTNASTNSTHLTLTIGIVAILCLVFIVNRLVWTPLLSYAHRYGE